LLNIHKVKYVIVGAYAYGCYAVPRFTNDLDIFIEPSVSNIKRVSCSLKDFGFDDSSVDWNVFREGEEIIRLGNPPLRIDILPKISGVSWKEVWKGKKKGTIGIKKKTPVYFIGKKQFIINKLASGRPKDIRDVEEIV
jgi:hypothetical protein